MEEKTPSVFRQKSLERISSPEELDAYLNVTKPSVWVILVAVILLLAGGIAWACLADLDTTLDVAVVSQEGQVFCLVPADKADAVMKTGTVTVGGVTYTLTDAGRAKMVINAEMDVSVRLAGQLAEGTVVTLFDVEAALADGVYEGSVTVETVRPISFILN